MTSYGQYRSTSYFESHQKIASLEPIYFNELPVEVISMICSDLSYPELKICHTISRKFREAIEPLLYHTIYLKANAASFDRLQAISTHPQLRKYVRTIQYDGRMMEDNNMEGMALSRHWHGLLSEIDRSRYRHIDDLPEVLRARFTEQESAHYFERFRGNLESQQALLANNREATLLAEAMRQFPCLEELQYCINENDDFEIDMTTRHELSPDTRKALFQAKETEESPKRFWKLLEATTLAEDVANITTLRGTNMELMSWLKHAPASTPSAKALSALHTLLLDFDVSEPSIGSTDRLHRLPLDHYYPLMDLLKNATSVETLHIVGLNTSAQWKLAHTGGLGLPFIIPSSGPWAHLQELSLRNFTTTQLDLESILLRYTSTLKTLDLSNILFCRAQFGMHISQGNYQDSWVTFFHFLHEKMSLTSINLHGCFSNNVREAWIVLDGRSPEWQDLRSYQNPSIFFLWETLKFRLEDYITHGPAMFPFTPKQPRDMGGSLFQDIQDVKDVMPWTWVEDKSFQFDLTRSYVGSIRAN